MSVSPHPFTEQLDKKLRNLTKKHQQILELLQKQKSGSELKPEQLEKISQKAQTVSQIEEINRYKKMFEQSEKEKSS